MQTNGSKEPGPPFAFMGAIQGILPRTGILEMLEKNAATQGKENLMLGPLFRKVADDFRNWSKYAEPGWRFQAPEVNFIAVRLSAVRAVTSLSEEGQRQAEAAAQGESLPRIVLE